MVPWSLDRRTSVQLMLEHLRAITFTTSYPSVQQTHHDIYITAPPLYCRIMVGDWLKANATGSSSMCGHSFNGTLPGVLLMLDFAQLLHRPENNCNNVHCRTLDDLYTVCQAGCQAGILESTVSALEQSLLNFKQVQCKNRYGTVRTDPGKQAVQSWTSP